MLVTPSKIDPGVTAVEPVRPPVAVPGSTGMKLGKNRVDGCLEDVCFFF